MSKQTTIIDHPISRQILEYSKNEYDSRCHGYTIYEKGGMVVSDRYAVFYTGDLSGERIFLKSHISPGWTTEPTHPFDFKELLGSFKTIDKGEIKLPKENINFTDLSKRISFGEGEKKITIKMKYFKLLYKFKLNKKIDYEIKLEKNAQYKIIVFSQKNLHLLISNLK